MAISLFAHLNGSETARAELLQLFADPARIARKPRCGRTKDFSYIRTAAHALAHAYIQPNSPVAYSRMVFDLDWDTEKSKFHDLPLRYLAAENAWENELGLPAPNWAAICKDKNSAHIGYELETPVARHENARVKPQRYLAAVEEAYSLKLEADSGYNGLLCKNPVNATWDLYKGPDRARDLHELAEYVKLEPHFPKPYDRTPRGEVGRNVYLFDEVRFFAYDKIGEFRTGRFESWEQFVISHAERINTVRYDHLTKIKDHAALPFSECKAIGRSIAHWVWKNHGKSTLTTAFSELQSWRGTRGAAASAKVKRERRETQIINAIGLLTAQAQIASMGEVAALIGCAKCTLSKHYGHLFQGPLQ